MQLAASKEFMVNAIYAHSIKVNGYLLSATVHKTECRGNVVMQSPPFYPIAPQTFLLSEVHTQRIHSSSRAFLVHTEHLKILTTLDAILDVLNNVKFSKQRILTS